MNMAEIEIIQNYFPSLLLAGPEALRKLPEHLPSGKMLVLCDETFQKLPLFPYAKSILGQAVFYALPAHEPTMSDIAEVLDALDTDDWAGVIGIGGGSVLDVSKVICVLLGKRGNIREVFAHPPERRDLFFAAIPTTAGTGSEATPNALIIDEATGRKTALISKSCIPDVAVLDPLLIEKLPPVITAYTGVDALCHLAESYISVRANSFSRLISLQGLQLVCEYLPLSMQMPQDLNARMQMLYASYFGGAALSIAGTTAVHALAYSLSRYGVPHGVANSLLFEPVMRNTLDNPGRFIPEYDQLCGLIHSLPLPVVTDYGISPQHIGLLSEEAMNQQRLLKNHPVPVDFQCIKRIFSDLFI